MYFVRNRDKKICSCTSCRFSKNYKLTFIGLLVINSSSGGSNSVYLDVVWTLLCQSSSLSWGHCSPVPPACYAYAAMPRQDPVQRLFDSLERLWVTNDVMGPLASVGSRPDAATARDMSCDVSCVAATDGRKWAKSWPSDWVRWLCSF